MSTKHTMLRVSTAILAGSALLMSATACSSRLAGDSDDAFPSKTITLLTPTAAGGGTDLTARTLGKELEKTLGVSVVIENRPGGANSVGMQHLATLKPNGYSIAVFPVEIAMLGHQGYDLDVNDYDYLAQTNLLPGTIAVPASSPYQTLEDLVEAARANPGTVTIANSGPGSIWEAGGIELGRAAGVEFTAVPFEGAAPAVTAAIGGQVDAVVAASGETGPAHHDGRLRVLASLTEEAAPGLPDVPTATELGYDVLISSWGVIAAPAGLDPEVAKILEDAIKKGAQSDSFITLIESAGNAPLYRDAADATEFVHAEDARFKALYAESK